MVGFCTGGTVNKGVLPHFIYITGCDGTGKSTQAKLLEEKLQTQGVKPVHLWLRFPFLFSLPLLIYARWKKLSWYEEHNGVKHGYWEFQHSWVMRNIFPWLFLLDAFIASIWKVYLPILLGKTIVCERYTIDMLADIEIGLNDSSFHKRLPGTLFLNLLPKESRIVILDLDEETARNRRADLFSDTLLGKRLSTFRRLACDLVLQTEDSQNSIDLVHNRIWKYVN
jgi:thymidylate kinase